MPGMRIQMVGQHYIMQLPKGTSFPDYVANFRHLAIVQLLAVSGTANVNAQSKSTGYTPISMALLY